jgi:hypothetical protein
LHSCALGPAPLRSIVKREFGNSKSEEIARLFKICGESNQMTTSNHVWKAIRLLFLGCLLAFCAKAEATITLSVTSPAAGALAGNNLHIVVASVNSTYQIQSVTATVSGRLTNLTFDATAGWIGDISLAGLPRGPQTLSFSATDVFGNSGQTQVSFIYDQPPTLTVLEPTLPVLTRPQLHVVAKATDDDPIGAVIRVYYVGPYGTILFATATSSLDTFIDLSAWDGQSLQLEFDATDSAGQRSASSTFVYVVSNTNVVEIDRVSGTGGWGLPTTILDVSTVAILFGDGTALKSKSRINGTEQVLMNNPNLLVAQAFLTSHGAIFDAQNELYEVRDGTLIDLGACFENVVVKGNYAIWETGIVAGFALALRDLLSGTNVIVSSYDNYLSYDVAANGDVVYSVVGPSSFRYRNGVTTTLGYGTDPITDGVNVGYNDGSLSSFALLDGTNETILAPSTDSRAVSGEWTAYIKPGTGENQVWTRSPSGVQTQRTFFGFSSDLYGLAPDGDVMVISYPSALPKRLSFIPSGSSPSDLGPWGFGAPFWIQGNWYASLGSSLVAFVVPSPPAISASGWNTNGQFSFHIAAGLGQQVVTQESNDLFNWTSLSTNFVSSTFGIDAAFPVDSGSKKKFYRVISVH